MKGLFYQDTVQRLNSIIRVQQPVKIQLVTLVQFCHISSRWCNNLITSVVCSRTNVLRDTTTSKRSIMQ